MKKITITLITAVFCLSASATPTIKLYHLIVTASTSPSNPQSLQNAMEYVVKGGVVGQISTDIGNDPKALNDVSLLRACDIIYSSFPSWDATNGPTGPFAGESGKRLAWLADISDSTNTFLASGVSFVLDSNDHGNHSLYYAGNIATNTANNQLLTFSSTLMGYYYGNGVTNAYYNGEDIATHPINRLVCMVREGWYVTDTNALSNDLNYFKSVMPFSATATFTVNGYSASSSLSSNPYLDCLGSTNGFGVFKLEGQRQLGMTYSIWGLPLKLNNTLPWAKLYSGRVDGFNFTGTYWPNGFYKASED